MKRILSMLAVASLTSACGGGGGGGDGDADPVFVHTTTAAGPSTTIRHARLDDNPSAHVHVTPTLTHGSLGFAANPHPIGVFYEEVSGTWEIRNLDGAPIPADAGFFVTIQEGSAHFVHTVDAGNRSFNTTRIDDVRIDGNPDAVLFATQFLNAPPGIVVANPNEIGVYIGEFDGLWRIFNQDNTTTMPLGADFFVTIFGGPTSAVFRHHKHPLAKGLDTAMSHPTLDDNPFAILHVTQNWNPDDDGVYNDHPIAVYYDEIAGRWAVTNTDATAVPGGASFNVWIQ